MLQAALTDAVKGVAEHLATPLYEEIRGSDEQPFNEQDFDRVLNDDSEETGELSDADCQALH